MKKSIPTKNDTLDKLFLSEFVKEYLSHEWYDLIEEQRMQEFRKIWKVVTYTCSIDSLNAMYTSDVSSQNTI